MKQSDNDYNVNVGRLKVLLNRAKEIDSIIENKVEPTKPKPKPKLKPRVKEVSLFNRFKSWVNEAIDKLFNLEPKIDVNSDEYKERQALEQIKERYSVGRFIKQFEGKYNVKLNDINRLLDITRNEVIDSNLPKNCNGGNVGGHSSPLFYEPLMVDIHNELAQEVNDKTLKELKEIEHKSDKLMLRHQDIVTTNESPNKRGMRGKFPLIQTKFFDKRNKAIKEVKKIEERFEHSNVKEILNDGLNYYGKGLSEEKILEVKTKLMNNVSEVEGELLNKNLNKLQFELPDIKIGDIIKKNSMTRGNK